MVLRVTDALPSMLTLPQGSSYEAAHTWPAAPPAFCGALLVYARAPPLSVAARPPAPHSSSHEHDTRSRRCTGLPLLSPPPAPCEAQSVHNNTTQHVALRSVPQPTTPTLQPTTCPPPASVRCGHYNSLPDTFLSRQHTSCTPTLPCHSLAHPSNLPCPSLPQSSSPLT
jgi:hypothetical protein